MNNHDVTALLERLIEPLEDELANWDDVLRRAAGPLPQDRHEVLDPAGKGHHPRPALEPTRDSKNRSRHRRRVIVLAAAALVVAVGAAAAFGTARVLLSGSSPEAFGKPAWSPDGRSIAYVVFGGQSGPTEISIASAHGSRHRTVARGRSLSSISPIWSPDSRRIGFLAYPCAASEWTCTSTHSTRIYTVGANGSQRQQLASGGSMAWSPDGRRIVFVSYRDGNPEVYVMNARGGDQRRLTLTSRADVDPVWSPDGRKIAFVSAARAYTKGVLRSPEIHVINADGTGRRTLARGDSPFWSPDGRKIAFVRESVYLERQIYVMNADGSGQQRVARGVGVEEAPRWSPDGRKIAFVRTGLRSGDRLLTVINADGSAQRTVARNVHRDGPSWSPDARKLAFVSSGEVYVVNADGTRLRRLTDRGD